MPSERTMFFKRGILCFGYGRWERIYDCSQQLQDRFTLGLFENSNIILFEDNYLFILINFLFFR